MFEGMLQAIVDRIAHASDGVALTNDNETCDYANLGARCQGIMDVLEGAAEGVVMIYGHKEVDAVAAMLACALIRRPFVFVDTANPMARIAQIAQTAESKLIVCTRPLPGSVDGQIVDARSVASRQFAMKRVEVDHQGIFYIAFTSGSTGTPKGVQIGYDNFGYFFEWYGALLRCCRGGEAHVNHASLSFDMGMLDLWPSLALGKPVILLNHRYNALPLANLRMLKHLSGGAPGSWFSTPTFLSMMCAEASFRQSTLPELRTFFLGGEPAARSLVATLMERFPGAEIWHAYGPTEVTCLTHCVRLTASDLACPGPLSLGRAIPPNEIRVVGDDDREVEAGECGEIELGGPQVAHGYLPKSHPQNQFFGTRDGKRFYRTGDYGAVDQEGNLTVNGRVDGQLKWNGNRVEIGEIERVAQRAIGVRQAVVVPLKHENRVIDLILAIQMHDDDECKRSALVKHLTDALPNYMRPRSIRFVDRLPMTLHGKVDRARLIGRFSEKIVH
jgi:D-alanine--poly(phosphoribitol) ligase subunit 1